MCGLALVSLFQVESTQCTSSSFHPESILSFVLNQCLSIQSSFRLDRVSPHRIEEQQHVHFAHLSIQFELLRAILLLPQGPTLAQV